ncbi:MAG: ParB N-terminal domain-containing protein [Sphingopyxis sp.]|uniref:ParB/RepB/Spo0J family partition protein n=1 Tax=Sphingopyxis sp. TaxID=1908224 RepID=UPI003D80BCD0
MASTPKDAAPVVDEVLELNPAEIDVSGRVGLFFPEKAEAYGVLIARDGQRTPITVRRNGSRAKLPWKLVAGLHRHAGCLSAGLPVRAIVVEGDEDELRAVQASENLDRRELLPLERAMFVAAVAEAARNRAYALHGVDNDRALGAKAKAAGGKMPQAENDRANRVQFTPVEKADDEAAIASGFLMAAYSWRDATAEACGLNIDALKRSLRIYRIIVEPNRDLMDAFKDCAVAANASALLAICGQGTNPANVRAIVEWLIANPHVKTADEAMVALELMPSRGGIAVPTTGDTKFLNGVQSNLQRLSLSGQRRAAEVIAQAIAPTALVAVRDALNARIGSAGSEPSGEARDREMRMALQSALNLIGDLKDGVGVDDDQIAAAHETVRTTLNAAMFGTTVADPHAKGDTK